MRRVAFITMAMLSGAAAFGQGLLDCVDPDVLRALLLQGQSERPTVFTSAVPAELAPLRMPGGFAWIGSAERTMGRADATTNSSQVTAAWRSSLAPAAARAATATALTSSGWEIRGQSVGNPVFSSSANPMSQTACRNGKPVSMSTAAMDGVTYVMFTIQRGNNNDSTCNSSNQFMRPATGFDPYLPRLEMPADPATGATVRMPSYGTSIRNGTFIARAQFAVKDSPGNVARHFAKQMADQGWISDASWNGTATAGSSWSRRGDGGGLIQATLMVTAADERQFTTVLRVLSLQ